nr:transposase [Methylobacterium sp. Leaf102]
MPHPPDRFAGIILWFAQLFVHLSWRHAQALLIGAILCPGRRTVGSVLRITGRARDREFVNTHRVLGRAEWSPRSSASILLRLSVSTNSRHGRRAGRQGLS